MEKQHVYLSKGFLSRIDAWEREFRAKRGNPETGEFIPAELRSLECIIVLLLCSELLTDYDKKHAEELYRNAVSNQACNSFGELIVKQGIKQGRFKDSVAAFSRYCNENGGIDIGRLASKTMYRNAGYFLDSPQADCDDAASKTGLSITGIDFDFKDFFTACNLSNYVTDAQLTELDKVAHKGNGLVIIDRYIFEDASFDEKLPNIVNTVKKFVPVNLFGKFELAIVTRHNGVVEFAEQKARELLNELGGEHSVSFKLIAPNHLQESDRFILSNYLCITVGHPWDRKSVLSSSCILSQDSKDKLQAAYRTWLEKLKLAKELLNRAKANSHNSFLFETDNTTHRLLNLSA